MKANIPFVPDRQSCAMHDHVAWLPLDLGVVESIDPFRKNLAVIVELAAPDYGGVFQLCENHVLLNENVPARSWDHAHVMSSIRLVDHT